MRFKIISEKTLQSYLKQDDILLFDLRGETDYKKGHIPGAKWHNWETLEQDIEQILRASKKNISWIILYCDYGNISLVTARDLARHGYPVISLNGGFVHYSGEVISSKS